MHEKSKAILSNYLAPLPCLPSTVLHGFFSLSIEKPSRSHYSKMLRSFLTSPPPSFLPPPPTLLRRQKNAVDRQAVFRVFVPASWVITVGSNMCPCPSVWKDSSSRRSSEARRRGEAWAEPGGPIEAPSISVSKVVKAGTSTMDFYEAYTQMEPTTTADGQFLPCWDIEWSKNMPIELDVRHTPQGRNVRCSSYISLEAVLK